MKLKQWRNIFHMIVNTDSKVQRAIRVKNRIIKHVMWMSKLSWMQKRSWSLSTCICENNKYLKSVANNSVTECDEVIIVMNNISTKRTNTMTTNVRSTAPMNCQYKKVRDCLFYAQFY